MYHWIFDAWYGCILFNHVFTMASLGSFILFFFLFLIVECFLLNFTQFVFQPEEALSDDFLFPMTSRFSYASSPESDLDLSPEPRSGLQPSRPRGLVKSSSDPSIATQDDIPSYNAPPPYAPPNGYQQIIQEFEYGRGNGSARGNVLPPDKQHDKYPLTPPDRQAAPELPPRIDRTNKPPRANINVSRYAFHIVCDDRIKQPSAAHTLLSPYTFCSK